MSLDNFFKLSKTAISFSSSRFPVSSSSKIKSEFREKARKIATLCFSPPDKSLVFCFNFELWILRKLALFSSKFKLVSFWIKLLPIKMLFLTESCSIKLKSWKTTSIKGFFSSFPS
ncbi:hypothetical protein MHL_3562 [Mesomycoplasma hyopneumoniae 7422]|nr:hypothetical protein MHL_3562 [Mesomycoplasma hyopneumoniae 7422]